MMETKQILIVEKNPDHLSVTESRLIARGFSVTSVSSSEEAVSVLEHKVFDLILISAGMELVNGEELTVKIRRATQTCFVPIVLLIGEENLAELIHSVQQGFDDFITIPFNPLTLQLRVMLNIRRAEDRMQANPLTKLPGNLAIERTLKERIAEDAPFSVCYLDINNFKSFNDIYGYDKGDEVIRQTARLIVRTAKKCDGENCFVGHVGGDDFIAIVHPDNEARFAKEFINEFDRMTPGYYFEEDQRRKYVSVKNRKGKNERFPLMSISIAAMTNLYRKYANPGEISQVAAEVKKFLKTQSGSNYLRDRREQQLEKLDEAVEIFSLPQQGPLVSPANAEPLGHFLLTSGLINELQLEEALKRQTLTGERLGQVLISMNLVRSFEVGKMLEKKLGVPYISLSGRELSKEVSRLFTGEYVRAHRVLPIELKNGKLILAMIDPFDIHIIDDIERTTGYRVIPALALEEEFERFFEHHYRKAEAL